MKKHAVIFDLNGVFVDSPKLSDRFCKTFGIKDEHFLPALREVMAHVRLPGAASVYSHFRPHFQRWGLDLAEQHFLDFWFNAETLNEDMVALATELKEKKYQLFILSNNLRERSHYYEKHFPFLDKIFKKQYYSWKSGFIKPDPRAYQFLLTDNNLTPDEVIYFDDTPANIEAAQKLGIESHVFEGAEQVRKKLKIT